MSNPLLDKFYELHPEKKEEEKPVHQDSLELLDEDQSHKKSSDEVHKTLTVNDQNFIENNWQKWVDVYRDVKLKASQVSIPSSDTISITTKHPTSVNDLSNTHKMNYQFSEMAERIKLQVATVTNVEMHTDYYSNQTKYIFEVVQNGRNSPF